MFMQKKAEEQSNKLVIINLYKMKIVIIIVAIVVIGITIYALARSAKKTSKSKFQDGNAGGGAHPTKRKQ